MKERVSNISNAKKALDKFEEAFEKVVGEVSKLYTQPLKAMLETEENKAKESLKYEGMTAEEIDEKIQSDKEAAIQANIEAANAALAEMIKPAKKEVEETEEVVAE